MKTIRFIGMALLTVVISLSLTACGGDDEEDVGGTPSIDTSVDDEDVGTGTPSTDASVITTDDGESLVLAGIKIGNYTVYSFIYDNQGRCTYAYGDMYDYVMTYDPFTLERTFLSEYECGDYTVSFNNAGYISKITIEENFDNNEDGAVGTITYNFSYDGSGHLTKISMNGSGTFYENRETAWTKSGTNTLVWSGGNLMSSKYVVTENYDEDVYSETYTYTFEYGSTENKYNVCTEVIARGVSEDFYQLALIGYLGKGTAYLPSNASSLYAEDDHEIMWDTTMSYTLNDNGTIQTETYNSSESFGSSSTNTYLYSTLSESTRAVADELTSEVSSEDAKITDYD